MVLRTHGQVRECIVASSVGADNKSNLNALQSRRSIAEVVVMHAAASRTFPMRRMVGNLFTDERVQMLRYLLVR